MTPHRCLLPLACLVALLASACGVSAEDFCKQFVDNAAQKSAECYGGSSEASLRKIFDSFDVCGDFKRAVARKTMVFDSAKGQACLDAAKKATCDSADVVSLEQSQACTEAFAGVGAVGAECYSSLECAVNSTCESTTTTASACPGKCKALAAVGADCGGTTGMFCSNGNACGTTTKKCIAYPGVGESCAETYICKPGGYCGADKKCAAFQTSGACPTGVECAPRFACTGATGAKTCTPRKKLGEACTDGQRECENGYSCSVAAGSKCVEAVALAAVCAPSSATSDGIACTDGYCDSGTKVCTAFKAVGAACTPPPTPNILECGTYTFCGADGKCPISPICHVP